MEEVPPDSSPAEQVPRRTFLTQLPSALMAFGLAAGYGMFAVLIGRFLFPSRLRRSHPQYVADLAGFAVGDTRTYVSPAAERVVLTRVGDSAAVSDCFELSSVCPHLGCQVRWESQNNRLFVPVSQRGIRSGRECHRRTSARRAPGPAPLSPAG